MNPFDREINTKPVIKILIHSCSLFDYPNPIVERFLQLNEFDYIDIDVTPIDDDTITKVLKKYNYVIPKYDYGNRSIVMLYPNGFKNATFFNYDKWNQPTMGGSKITYNDRAMTSNYDYFVISPKDIYYNSKLRKENEITIEDAINFIRILLVNNNILYINKYTKVNEGLYYLYRMKTIFQNYQLPWSIAVHSKNEKIQTSEIFNNLQSLSTRLDFICRAVDKINFYSLKNANNDTFDNALYHLGYFIMLCTGAFDDLAWIINNLYNFNLHHKELSLRISDPLKLGKFAKKVQFHNSALYNYLLENKTRNFILSFYPIRDALQHRNFLDGFKILSGGISNNRFYIDNQTIKLLFEVFDEQSDLKKWGIHKTHDDQYSIDCFYYTKEIFTRFSNFINNTLYLLNWEDYLNLLSEDSKTKIITSQEKFKNGFWQVLGFENEPLYF